MSGNTVKIPSGLVAYKLFLLFSRLLISNNLNLSPSYNNSDYEITSKCFTASVSLLNQHLEMFSSSENYKYLTCSMFCSSYHCACYGCWDCCAVLLCFAWLTQCFCLLFFLTFPPQNSIARLKVSHPSVSGGVGDRCASSLSLANAYSLVELLSRSIVSHNHN